MRKKQQRKSYTTEFKVKVALEAIKGQRTINEIATLYGVHPNLVTQMIPIEIVERRRGEAVKRLEIARRFSSC
jgi:putative transposase